jgi:hypothetical protein
MAFLRTCFLCLVMAPIGQAATWTEAFSEERLDPRHWVVTTDGDFREWSVQVADVPHASGNRRLGVRADTRGTRDETVKVLGVRSIPSIALDRGVDISVDLDWNAQANGSYLSAAIVLSPDAALQNPFKAADWLKVEYIGVPPGRNARMVVGVRRAGHERTLFNEGWPERGRAGRPIALQHLAIAIQGGTVQIRENERLVYESKEKVVDFDEAHLYLQMSSHSNYPARTVYFDNVRVEESRRR